MAQPLQLLTDVAGSCTGLGAGADLFLSFLFLAGRGFHGSPMILHAFFSADFGPILQKLPVRRLLGVIRANSSLFFHLKKS